MFTYPVGFISSKGANPIATYISSHLDYNYTTSFSYTIPNFGGVEEAPNRIVVVGIYSRVYGTSIASVTIAGVNATIATQSASSSNQQVGALAYAVVPTGTTSFTVNVTTNGSSEGQGISVYCVSGSGETTHAGASSVQGSSLTLSTHEKKSAIIALQYQGNLTAISWGGTLGITTSDAYVQVYYDTMGACSHINLDTLQINKTITRSGSDRITLHYIEFV